MTCIYHKNHAMRRVISFICFGLLGAAVATAGNTSSYCNSISANLVANCGFEAGAFTNWTFSGNTSNPGNNYYGVDAFDANTGNYGAYLSNDSETDGGAALVMSQTLSALPSTTYIISFYVAQPIVATGTYTHDFTVAFDGTTLLSLANPAAFNYTEYTYEFTTAASGNSNVLSFTVINPDDYFSLDDIVVEASTVPEPSTPALLGLGLIGLGFVRAGLFVRGFQRSGSAAARALNFGGRGRTGAPTRA